MTVRLVLLGAPGSGKGTQGKRLADHFGIAHISTGDLIRDQIARGTAFGLKVEEGIAAGNFVSDNDIVNLVSERLSEPDATGYVLDGFPRDVAQAVIFEQDFEEASGGLRTIELSVTPETVLERLAGRLVCPQCDAVYHETYCPPKTTGRCDNDGSDLVRRPDDEPVAILHRLDIYEQVTLPLRAFYAERSLLDTIPAEDDPDVVFRRILEVVTHKSVI